MTTSNWTPEAEQRLTDYLARDGYVIPRGLGTETAACSIAAVNLALTGRLTDTIPDCMSFVVGKWLLLTQDAVPSDVRNSQKWKAALVKAAGTGRAHELERVQMVIVWMWETLLPALQPWADEGGYGTEWQRMCDLKDPVEAAIAEGVAWDTRHRDQDARQAADAAGAAYEASHGADYVAKNGDFHVAEVLERVAEVADKAAAAVSWEPLDPASLLTALAGRGATAR